MRLTKDDINLLTSLREILQEFVKFNSSVQSSMQLGFLEKMKYNSFIKSLESAIGKIQFDIAGNWLENPTDYFIALLNTIASAQHNLSNTVLKKPLNVKKDTIENALMMLQDNIESILTAWNGITITALQTVYKKYPHIQAIIIRIIDNKKMLVESKNSSQTELNNFKNEIFDKKLSPILAQMDSGLSAISFQTKGELDDLHASISTANAQKAKLQEQIDLLERPMRILEASVASLEDTSKNATKSYTTTEYWSEEDCFSMGYTCKRHCVHSGTRDVTHTIPDTAARDNAAGKLIIARQALADAVMKTPTNQIMQLQEEILQLTKKVMSIQSKIDEFSRSNNVIYDLIKKLRAITLISNPSIRTEAAHDFIFELQVFQTLGKLYDRLTNEQCVKLLELLSKLNLDQNRLDAFIGAISNEEKQKQALNVLDIPIIKQPVGERKQEIVEASAPAAEIVFADQTETSNQGTVAPSAPTQELVFETTTNTPAVAKSKSIAASTRSLSRIESLYLDIHTRLTNHQAELKEFTSNIDNRFLCPISKELILKPAVAADGFTYDEHFIQEWLGNKTSALSPSTGLPLKHLHLSGNQDIESAIISLLQNKNAELEKAGFTLPKSVTEIAKNTGSPIYTQPAKHVEEPTVVVELKS